VYSHIPAGTFERRGTQVLLNGDPMGLGRRLGITLLFSPLPNVEVIGFASRRVDTTPGVRNRAQIVVRYQFAGVLNRWLRPR
jgi:hypothetical protein